MNHDQRCRLSWKGGLPLFLFNALLLQSINNTSSTPVLASRFICLIWTQLCVRTKGSMKININIYVAFYHQ